MQSDSLGHHRANQTQRGRPQRRTLDTLWQTPRMDDSLADKIRKFRPAQRRLIEQLVDAFIEGTAYTINPRSDFATDEFAQEFADILRFHHLGTGQPLSKDKFEYAMVQAFREMGVDASKTEGGTYPGQDITVGGVPWSLKTEAARNTKANKLHISKFMEMGKGAWQTEADLEALRERMFTHLTRYDRILSLRCLSQIEDADAGRVYKYELVEIPKELLERSDDFPIEFKTNSRQTPIPASCYVLDETGVLLLELYFDGGTERKLQIRNILKDACIVHATWEVTVPA